MFAWIVLTILPFLAMGCPSGSSGSGGGREDPDESPTANENDNEPGDTGDGSASGALLFAVIGDYGDDDDDTQEVAGMIRGWGPNFILTTGDNDYSDGTFRGTFEGLELGVGQYFHEFIGNYQGTRGEGSAENQFFPTPGDHDWGDTCDDPQGLDDYLAYFTLPAESSGNERYYDFRRGPVHFFALHSIEDCEPDGVTESSLQGEWVRRTAAASDAPFKVAYFHHPPYSSGEHVGDGAHMQWPWAQWGFDLVMAGHDHDYERIVLDDVTYLVVGLGGVDRRCFAEVVEGSAMRYCDAHGALRVEVFDDRMQALFITVDGTVVDEFAIESQASTTGSGGSGGPDGPPPTEGDWYHPGVQTTWQWQLQPDGNGTINTTYDVDVYDIDLFDVPASLIEQLHADGRRVICYFSAGSYEEFREDAGEFLAAELGQTLDVFADERWLDIRSDNVRRIMGERLDRAVQKGCDGVEPDNVDGFDNDSGFDLTPADQLAFNRFLSDEAHQRGLAVGLKNDLSQIPDLVEQFDFSVNEQCHAFDECDALQPFIDAGKPVFNAEYADEFVNDPQPMCQDAVRQGLRTLVLPLHLDDSSRFSCDQ